MARYGFLRRPAWILGLLAAVAIALLCFRLGVWQLDRLEQRRAYNRSVEAAIAAPARPLDDVLPASGSTDVDAISYRRVQLEGTYGAGERVLFGRALGGAPGDHLLTPFITNDDRTVIVDRGWIPLSPEPSAASTAPPGGAVQVVGFLLPPEANGGTTGTDDEPITEVDLDAFGAALGRPVAPMYLRLQTQDPAQDGEFPRPVPLEDLGEGPHLGYAVQWFIFGTIALIGFGVLARKEERGEGGAEPASSRARRGSRSPRPGHPA